MAYNRQPWLKDGNPDPTNIDRVKAIREYLKKDSSFERLKNSGVKILWNGATKADHDSTNALADPAIVCNGLRISNDKKRQEETTGYITRDTLSALIDNDACPALPDLVFAGAKEMILLDNTPEKVDIFMANATDAAAIPTVDQCKQHMHEIRDGCDGVNAMNWKAGGSFTLDGFTYSITPKGDRPPAPNAPSAWCQRKDDVIWMWGAGWLNSGFGKELKDAFVSQGYSFTDSEWSFQYEFKDGHEWQASVVNYVYNHVPYIDGADFAENAMTQTINWPGLNVQCAR